MRLPGDASPWRSHPERLWAALGRVDGAETCVRKDGMMVIEIASIARRRWAMGALTVSLMLAGCYSGGAQIEDEGEDDGADDGERDGASLVGPGTCVDTDKFFKENIWTPVLSKKCIGCHNPTGVAGNTDLVLQMSDYPGYLEANQQTMANVARLEIDGMPLLLAKPSAKVEHGGGLQLPDDSEEYALLADMIERFKAPTHCKDDADIERFFDGIQELDEEGTLRKATFLLASRMPTPEELDMVRGQGIDALDPVLDEAFGITHTKQQIRPKDYLTDALAGFMETTAKALNARARDTFAIIKSTKASSSAEQIAVAREMRMTPLPPEPDATLQPFFKTLLDRSPILKRIEQSGKGGATTYHILEDELASAVFLEPIRLGNAIVGVINPRHQFYRQVYGPIVSGNEVDPEHAANGIRLMVLAAARADASFTKPNERRVLEAFRTAWSQAMDVMLASR